MDEPPKVHHHHHHKSKHRRSSSRRSVTEPPTAQSTTTRNATTNPIVVVQSQSNDDDVGEPPASSTPTTIQAAAATTAATKENANNEQQQQQHKTQQSRVTVETAATQNDEIDTETVQTDAGEERNIQKGILGYMDREIKTLKKPQSLSDPTASPAQRSTRSRSSIEKSPRRKRSKSESRRRRERKLIAAGEMEVRQANETLMRYLKQCSEINDASLSGELEIDKSIDDRRVHRKTKSQRERRGVGHNASIGGANGSGSGAGEFSKNGMASTSSKSIAAATANGISCGPLYMCDRIPPSGLSSILQELASDVVPSHGEIYNPFTPVVSPTEGPRTDKMFIQTPRGFRAVSDSTFLKSSMHIDPESNRSSVSTGVNLSCVVQRIWILVSNICHGLLAGLALAHILFIITTTPSDWLDGPIKHYLAFAEIYTNTFYCLAIVCLVSVFDRMDICRWSVFNSSETISFRWIIIVMIYMATIILCLSAESFDERLFVKQTTTNNVNMTDAAAAATNEMGSSRVMNMWSSLSLARSVAAIVGWILVGLTPSDDLLYHHLLEMEKYQLTQ